MFCLAFVGSMDSIGMRLSGESYSLCELWLQLKSVLPDRTQYKQSPTLSFKCCNFQLRSVLYSGATCLYLCVHSTLFSSGIGS